MYTINKSGHTKKSGNLFNDPRMYELELFLENETHEMHKDFEIKTDLQILTRWLRLMLINKGKNYFSSVFYCSISGPLSENKRKRNDS